MESTKRARATPFPGDFDRVQGGVHYPMNFDPAHLPGLVAGFGVAEVVDDGRESAARKPASGTVARSAGWKTPMRKQLARLARWFTGAHTDHGNRRFIIQLATTRTENPR